MSEVLLTHSNHLFNDDKQVAKMQPYPPLQPLLAAAALRSAGISIAFCDVTFQEPGQAFEQSLRDHSPQLVVVCEDDFNFLSKMCLGRNREVAFSMAQVAKAAGHVVAVHGPDSTDHIEAYLNAGFDYVLVGEVENTIVDLAQQWRPSEIPGLAYYDQKTGSVRYTPPRPLNSKLDSLPLPAWDLVDMDQYRQAWLGAHGYFSLNMVSSRGCPFHCNWCAKPTYGNHYHVRSPRLVAEEMRYLKTAFRPDHIWFADDIFALSPTWAADFANAVETLDARIPFKMQSRCDLMTRDSVTSLKRAGCSEVWMGAESGSQQVLDAMEKGIRVEQIYRARAHLARHDIRACFFLQFGYLGEGWEDIMATIQMVRDTKPDDIGVSVSYPLPGTKFFNLVVGQMGKKVNWTHSGELAMMFQGAYSTAFYRELADALRLEVRNGAEPERIREAWEKVYQLKGTAEVNGVLV
ncbi:MAG TPA: radical SAM protein [Bryobacteraceae bacterium]|nr:radical SAM protein [Bryobacteraceae bacterium]